MLRFNAIDLPGLKNVALTIAASLASLRGNYVCWVLGPMGAGKTTLTRDILYALGLDKSCTVTSPTFTYMNEYKIGDAWYAHLDLYRATAGLSIEDLGINDVRDYRGAFVEWPSAFDDTAFHLRPTHKIAITVLDEATRTIDFTTT